MSLRQRQKVQEVLRREREIVKAVLGRGECSEKGSPSFKIASEGTALPPQGFCVGDPCVGIAPDTEKIACANASCAGRGRRFLWELGDGLGNA